MCCMCLQKIWLTCGSDRALNLNLIIVCDPSKVTGPSGLSVKHFSFCEQPLHVCVLWRCRCQGILFAYFQNLSNSCWFSNSSQSAFLLKRFEWSLHHLPLALVGKKLTGLTTCVLLVLFKNLLSCLNWISQGNSGPCPWMTSSILNSVLHFGLHQVTDNKFKLHLAFFLSCC